MNLTLRRHRDDPSMLEIMSKDANNLPILWGAVDSDIVFEDESIRSLLKKNGEVSVALTIKEADE